MSRHYLACIKYSFIFCLCVIGLQKKVFAQNLEKVGQKDVLKLSGGISANQVAFLTTDTNSYREPYTWVLTGNLNIDIYDWNIPLSYTVSNYSKSFQQPFNQFSMHPTYKWIKVHAGYTQMSFSSYSLSGHTFLGGGVELTPPGKFRFSAMIGRLRRPIEPDTTQSNRVPSYKRMGMGFKAGYHLSNQEIEISMFKGWDIPNSLQYGWLDSSLRPMENVVLTFSGKTTIINKFSLAGEIAGSSMTPDSRLPIIKKRNLYSITGLNSNHSSTYIRYAYKTQLSYGFNGGTIGLSYEHVDPDYQTLGAYYANNDFENYTINSAMNMFKNKINVSINTGLQYDDLQNSKTSKTSRYVMSINVGLNLSEKISLSSSYSNFTTYINIRSPFETINQTMPVYYIDSLRFTQVNESVTASLNYNFSKSDIIQHNMTIMCNSMQIRDNQHNKTNQSNMYSATTSYNLTWKPIELNCMFQLNANYNETFVKSLMVGPTFLISKMLFKKAVRANVSISQNVNYSAGNKEFENFIFRVVGGYTWLKRHVFSLALVAMTRKNFTQQFIRSVTDVTGTLSYNYNF